jgi:hypothetical protein
MRAYESNFTTFSRGLSSAPIPLADMAEIWSDQLNANTNKGLLIGTGYGVYPDNPPLIFATFNTERMRIRGNGNIGVGSSSPALKFEIVHTSSNASYGNGDSAQFGLGLINNSGSVNSWSNISFAQSGAGAVLASVGVQFKGGNVTDLVLATNSGSGNTAERVRVTGAGLVGIGVTPAPASPYKLDVAGAIHASGDLASAGNLSAVSIAASGNITATGNIVGGTVVATFQDVAEWVPTGEDVLPATVVVLSGQRSNEVVASSSAYDTTVAGVVSAEPGIVLGKGGANKAKIATTGRVKVKVDASHGPIQIGDLLVSSDIRGTAMKSEPLVINGRRFHQPGTIIGKALEPLASGTGEILVLLSLQ